MNATKTTRWKLTFEYDGTDFNGWQRQPGGRTVEGVIEQAFSTLFQRDIELIGQGRTDSGVHALGQVAHADLPVLFDANRIIYAMKGLLPADVALLKAETVHPDFHARFHASSRRYRYQLATRPMPLLRNQVWVCHKTPAEEVLQQSAGLITGRHDFINFCIPPEEKHATTLCTITHSEWVREDDFWIYRIEGDRFLRHMVRRLVGEMIRTAETPGKTGRFENLLTGKTTPKKAHAAPARGLLLEQVNYP